MAGHHCSCAPTEGILVDSGMLFVLMAEAGATFVTDHMPCYEITLYNCDCLVGHGDHSHFLFCLNTPKLIMSDGACMGPFSPAAFRLH